MSEIKLTPEQQSIHDSVIDWFKSYSKPYITVGGFAGTGKSTIVGFITETLKREFDYLPIAYVAYTGKASLVIKSKVKDLDVNNDYVGTIHSLIYKPILKNDEVVGWDRVKSLPYSLIVLDEASMVDKEIWEDLASFEIPILVVGDHGQLSPISNEQNFSLMLKPDYTLQTIHRQALGNPIIKLSAFVREHGYIPKRIFGKTAAKFDFENPIVQKIIDKYRYKTDSQILCGMNKTRVKLNNLIRQNNGFQSHDPYVGEKLICLKNNKKQFIMNGHIVYLRNIDHKTKFLSEIDISPQGRRRLDGLVTHRKAFGQTTYTTVAKETHNPKILHNTVYQHEKPLVNLFDFGYAISVHKSQGSQFKYVILFEERNFYQSDDEYCRWLYTAVTRASEKLVVIDNYF